MPEKVKKALQQLNQANFEQAASLFEAALVEQKKGKAAYFQVMLHLCIALFQSQSLQKAQKLCRQILQSAFLNDQATVYLALILGHLQQKQQALKICDQYIQLQDKQWKLFYAKGYILIKMQKYQQASENLGLAITKNKQNNPKSYILQAVCYVYLQDIQNAYKNIHYASLAIEEDQSKNCKNFYKYQVKNIKKALKLYQKYKQRVKNAIQEKILDATQEKIIMKNVIKVMGKSIMFCSKKYNTRKQIPTEVKLEGGVNKIRNQNILVEKSQNMQELVGSKSKIYQNIYEDLKNIDEIISIKSKNSISTDQVQVYKSNADICQWLKQKCSIF